jgi:segregation and condensation protein A
MNQRDQPKPALDTSWDQRETELAARTGDDRSAQTGDDLIIDVEGFEGPLDLLLAMARTQKVDLTKISVLALAEQYLVFVGRAQQLRLELAADYLVMAAWLAFLKSRLLLPKEEVDEDLPSGEEMAQRLAFRLARLQAMRTAAGQLMQCKRLGRDVFARGMPEQIRRFRDTQHTARLFDLLKAYADRRIRTIPRQHVVQKRTVWSIKEARTRLETLIGERTGQWVQLDLFFERYVSMPEATRTVVASSLGAALEMAREGLVDIRQERAFGPIRMRRRERDAAGEAVE